MRLTITLVDGRNGRAADAVVDSDVHAPFGDLLVPLLQLLGEQVHPDFARRVPAWVDGKRVDPTSSTGEAGVRAGAVVSLFEPADRILRSVPRGVAELRVVAGPGAGRIHRLPLGRTTIGCGATDWSLPDVRLPPQALRVDAAPDGSVTVEAAPGLVASLEEDDLDAPTPWPEGSHLIVGDTVLSRVPLPAGNADITVNTAEALIDYNRPPRMMPPPRERAFHMPDEPTEPRGRPLPWVMVLAPAVMAVPMALLLGHPRYLLFGLMSPVLALANYLSDKIYNRKEYRENLAEYEEKLATLEMRIADARVLERQEKRFELPDPAELISQAIGPGPRLWERRPDDVDHLRLRLGLAEMPPELTVEEHRDKTEEESPPPPLIAVPTWLGLGQLGVIGVAGNPETAVPLASWMVAQLALLHSPRDVRLVVLSDQEGEAAWGWVRWLPHARDESDGVSTAVGSRQESVGRRLNELLATIELREAGDSAKRGDRVGPDIVVLLDGARRLRTLPAVVELLRRGPAVGVRTICVDEQARQLPAECKAIAVLEMDGLRIHETTAEDTTGVTPDLVEPMWCETVARCLAPLRDTTPQEDSAGIPSAARLLEEIDLDPPTPQGIGARWASSPTTDVVLGAGYDGPFRLDLRRDGPHALIAGTTGSGKSELLQTLVASLAVANRPDDLTFVLVDYKGGSAFKDCARLPHTVGMVTDLDTHLVGRALVSLGAELHRREHLLAGPGAKDLEDYWALRAKQPELPSIPRLVLVIDEFASMVAELPDFVTGLVSIAQRGRSLGIHLVLATQRPSGVVTADIKANTNLRISLRVTDANDSDDVIGTGDAALIGKHQPGRAYVRSGASTLMPFQSGRVGGRSPDAAGSETPDHIEPLVWEVNWDTLGLPLPARPKQKGVETDEADTDLSALVDAVGELTQQLGVPPAHRPWLDALPEMITLAELPPPDEDEHDPRLPPPAAWGLIDLPAKQAQKPAIFQLGRSGSMYVIGGPRSGRSTALRSLAGALADAVPVSDLHIYGLDCGNGALLGLQVLAHTGAVVSRTQTGRAGRLLNKLTEIIDQRQEQMGRVGVSDLAELRESLPEDERPPYVLFVVDRWDGFMATLGEEDGGRMAEQVQSLLRDGPSVGVTVVVSGDRTLVSGRMGPLVEDKLVLRLADKGEFSAAGIHAKQVPDDMPDGRALTPDPVTELQLALLSAEVSGAGQNAALREVAARNEERDSTVPANRRPFQLRELPDLAPHDDETEQMLEAAAASIREGNLPFGIGGDELALVTLDLSGAGTAVIAGPPKSGKTTALCFVASAAGSAGTPVKAVVAVANPLAEQLGADCLLDHGSMSEEEIGAWIEELPAGGVLLIDDGDMMRGGTIGDALDEVVSQARARSWRIVVAGDVNDMGSGYSGWVYDARKSRQGLLLSPQNVGDADIYEARIARSLLASKTHPGRGIVLDPGGSVTIVQVPFRTELSAK